MGLLAREEAPPNLVSQHGSSPSSGCHRGSGERRGPIDETALRWSGVGARHGVSGKARTTARLDIWRGFATPHGASRRVPTLRYFRVETLLQHAGFLDLRTMTLHGAAQRYGIVTFTTHRGRPPARSLFGAHPERVVFQIGEAHELERADVRGLEHHGGCDAGLRGLLPPQHAETPLVAWLQAGELPFGMRRDEIVALRSTELEELRGDTGADDVGAEVLRARPAAAVAEVAGQRIVAAVLQRRPEDVGDGGGGEGWTCGSPSRGCAMRRS